MSVFYYVFCFTVVLVGVVVGAVPPFVAAMAVKTISEKTWSCIVPEPWRSDTEL